MGLKILVGNGIFGSLLFRPIKILGKVGEDENYSQVREQSTDMINAVIILVRSRKNSKKKNFKFFFCECK
jgi:hypothetical protein